MLHQVKIENYRSLKFVEVDLRPLTVLVGVNDSGKSSFLQALQRLSEGRGDFSEADYWRRDGSNPISIMANDTINQRIIINSLGESSSATHDRRPQGRPPGNSLQPTLSIQLPVSGIAMQSEGYSEGEVYRLFGRDGSGVPSLLDYLLRKDRRRFFAFVDALKRLVPGLEDVVIETPEPSQRRVDLIVEDGLSITAYEASAGVRLLIFFVALAFHPVAHPLILLEEPETGIHPKRLGDVMAILHQLTRKELGGFAAQVIMTTHSPYLLDLVDLETDQVLVFKRNEDGSRSAEAADRERLKMFLDEFLLGEVWFNQGEEGLVARR